jgi:hypothetical protein
VSRDETGEPGASPAALAVASAAILAFFLAVTVTPLANNDLWLHLTNGRWILEHGRVPTVDPYSFTAGGDRFYAHEWLAGLLFEGVHRAFGVTGLILLKPLCAGTALALLALAGRRLGARPLATLATLGFAIAITTARFVERPDLFSYALTGLYLLVLVRERERGDASGFFRASGIWVLVPAQWLWVQLHGYFLAGLALVGLHLAGEVFERAVLDHERPILTRRTRSGACAFVAMLGLGLLNPNGIEIYGFPFTVVGTDVFMQTVFEWTPTFATAPVRTLPLFLGFCLWVSLLAASCLDSRALLSRHRAFLRVGASGLAILAVFHPGVAAALLPDAYAPAGALLAASPARLLLDAIGRPDLEPALGAVGAVLRTLSTFGVVWLLLLGLLVVYRRKPCVAAIPILVALGFSTLRGAVTLGPALVLLILAAAFAYAVARRAVPAWQAGAALFFAILATRQNRNIVNFTLVTLPLLAAGLTRLAAAVRAVPARGATPRRAGASTWAFATAAVAVVLLAYAAISGWPYAPGYRKRPGLGVDPRFPAAAVSYVETRGLSGNVFNTYYNGAYLIHELWPRTLVFVDSRMDVYGSDRLKRYYEILRDPGAASRALGSGVDYAVLDYTFPPGGEREKGIFAYLEGSPDWALVQFDDAAVVYVHARRGERWVEDDRYELASPATYRPGAVSGMDAATRERYERELDRAIASSERSGIARLMKCEVLAARGDTAGALALVDAVLAADPSHAYAAIVGARLARRAGDRERSLGYYRRAVRLLPQSDELRREMGQG